MTVSSAIDVLKSNNAPPVSSVYQPVNWWCARTGSLAGCVAVVLIAMVCGMKSSSFPAVASPPFRSLYRLHYLIIG